MRIRGAKTELEEAGLETEGMVDSTAKLRQEIIALSGVDIMEADGKTFKSTYGILDELAQKWEDLSDIQQATITELIAGKRQGNIISSLMTNFDTAREALETSLNSSGSAMAEHAKWQQSLEAQINKLKASWQSLSQSFMSSDFLHIILDTVIGLVDGLTKLIDTFGTFQTLIGGFVSYKGISKILSVSKNVSGLKSIADILQVLSRAFPNAAKGMGVFTAALKGGVGIVGVLKAAISGLWTVVAAHPILAVVAAVGIVIAAFANFYESASEVAERVEELTSKFKEQHNELKKLKGDYDTSNESSMISRYEKLSKGVDNLGRNVSLTADEYSEYQGIVNQIAEQIPSLVFGYDAQGNALLSCKGNVEELTKAYEKLIHAQNIEVLNNSEDIEKNYRNVIEKASGNGAWSNNHGFWAGILKPLDLHGLMNLELKENTAKKLKDLLNPENAHKKDSIYDALRFDPYASEEIRDVLNSANIDVKWYQSPLKVLEDTLETNPEKIKNIVDEFYGQFDEVVGQKKTIAQAKLQEAFDVGSAISDLDYGNISEDLQSIAYQIVNSLDKDFFDTLEDEGKTVEQWTTEMLDQFNSIGKDDSAKISAAFDLQTKFNGGEINYGDYVNGLEKTGELIDGLELDEKIKTQIKLSIGLNEKGFVEEYRNLVNRLSDHTNYDFDPHIMGSTAEAFLNSLSAEELSVAIDVITKLSDNGVEETIQDIRDAIDREMLLRGLTLDLNLEVETAGLEALNTALAESKSATGLTVESIDALKARYEDLDGYNAAALFEETANGIRINSTELAKLEKEYKDLNKQEIDETLEKLVEEYNGLTAEINNCSDASKRADLYAQRDSILDQINDTATLAAQYKGLTSAYNEWQSAQESGQDRDMYESIISGREEIQDEMSRGWLDDATVEYLELLTGKELSTAGIDAQIAAYKELNNTIGNSGYSIWDFFTEDEDGNATSEGVFNFFDAVKSVAGETAAWVDENGAYNFDFEGFEYNGKIGDAAIAEILGTSEELVQIMLKAAEDAGFVVNIKGEYTDLANLKDAAEIANDRMKELSATTYTFNFNSTNIDDLNKQISEAETMLSNLKNKDGTLKVGVSQEDYRQAQDMIAALIYQKQSLDDSAILHVDTSQAKSDIEIAISKLQEFRQYANTLELETAIGADTSEAVTNIQSVLNYINGLDANIKAGLGLDTTEVQTAINNVQANIQAGIAIKQEDLDVVNASISSISNDMMVKLGLDTSLIDNYKATEQEAKGTVNWDNNIEKVTAWINQTHEANGTVNWSNNDVNVTKSFTASGTVNWTSGNKVKVDVISEANGTANANGTAGRAFKQGDWGIKGSGTALVGELGMETLVRGGHFYTIGDNGAEFIKYRQGDIIFNHKQTEELFKNGKVTSGGGRGKALAEGTAFAIGSNAIGLGRNAISKFAVDVDGSKTEIKKDKKGVTVNNSTTITSAIGTSGGGGKPNLSDLTDANKGGTDKKEFEEVFDWIEVAIERIEREIDNLDRTANSSYKSWSERNKALASEISKVSEEIKLQNNAASEYWDKAGEFLDHNSDYAKKIQNGTLHIDTLNQDNSNEELVEKIKNYQKWYELYLDCIDAAEELREEEAKLYEQGFENVQSRYDDILQGFEHTESMLNEYINQAEAKGHIVSKNYYNALIDNEKQNIDTLKREQAELIAERDKAVAEGKITKGSEAWYEQCEAIDSVTQAIEEGNTALIEYANSIRDIEWEVFDLIQERISDVTAEADFLIELMSSKDLFDDNGKFTEQGVATVGLHAQNYNTYMYQADEYAKEVSEIDKQLAKGYSKDLEDRRRELIGLQRDMILAAEDEKNVIRDLVEEGIEFELEALDERIQKYQDALDAQKDLYDYQKRVEEQTKEISSLQKQISAYEGDNSEEAKAKIQELRVSLEEAEADLEETEYDKYISDQQKLLDALYTEYESLLNERLDNTDALIVQQIAAVNENASTISNTLSAEANNVGATISDAMNNIWNSGEHPVLTMYGEGFQNKQTTTNSVLSGIKISVDSMVASLNKEAAKKTTANKTSTSAQKNPTTTTNKNNSNTANNTSSNSNKITEDTLKSIAAAIWVHGSKAGWEDDPTRKNKLSAKLGAANAKKVQEYINKYGANGELYRYWYSNNKSLDKYKYSAFKFGAKKIDESQLAWTQEAGQEYIVRPSDGAILTPVAKGDSVLTAQASNNIWQMANSPAEFIKDNLNLGSASVPNNSTVQNSYTQHLDKVVFSFPNVKNYDEMLAAVQKDKNFERLVTAMTIGKLTGGSSLAKGKAIR